jgi:hypothetical protein
VLDALSAAHNASRAVAARHLIGQEPGWTQDAYDRLTAPWAAVVGPAHPDDVRCDLSRETLRRAHPNYASFQAGRRIEYGPQTRSGAAWT